MMPWEAVAKVQPDTCLMNARRHHPTAFGYVKSLALDRITTHTPSTFKFTQRFVIKGVSTATLTLLGWKNCEKWCAKQLLQLQSHVQGTKLCIPYILHMLTLSLCVCVCVCPIREHKQHTLYIITNHIPKDTSVICRAHLSFSLFEAQINLI